MGYQQEVWLIEGLYGKRWRRVAVCSTRNGADELIGKLKSPDSKSRKYRRRAIGRVLWLRWTDFKLIPLVEKGRRKK